MQRRKNLGENFHEALPIGVLCDGIWTEQNRTECSVFRFCLVPLGLYVGGVRETVEILLESLRV